MALKTLDLPTVGQKTPQLGIGQRLRSGLLGFVIVLGLVLPSYLIGAAAIDVLSTDQTQGGYEPPYTDFTGQPIQAEQAALEGDQLIIRGRVLDSESSCQTGMWVFDIVGFDIPYRTVSDRALVIHRPHDFCRAAGFDTAAWDKGI